ncbi:MAG: Calx-beta domain-containing protein [Puniceicoccaceae bacterium]
MNKSLLLYLSVFTCVASSALFAADPILEYTFNTPTFTYAEGANAGSGALSTGQSGMKIGFRNALGGGPPRGQGQTWFLSNGSFYTVDMGGVSGLSNDYAFQNDAQDDNMGGMVNSTNAQGAAIAEAVEPLLSGLDAITVTGWIYVRGTVPLQSYARIVSCMGGGGGFELRHVFDTPGTLELRLNDGTAIAPQNRFTETQKWVFFAVSYDSLASGQEVRFYIGDTVSTVEAIVGAVAMAQGQLKGGLAFTLGNSAGGGNRVLPANFDNIRVYGEALSLAELEAVRADDLLEPIVLPLPPTGLSATVQSSTEVYLEWNDNSTNEEFFNLIRTENGVPTVIELPADTVSYMDTNLTPEKEYTYTVQSGITAGSLPSVGSATVTTPQIVTSLNKIVDLRIAEKSATGVTLIWTDPNAGEAGYIVEKFNDGNQTWEFWDVFEANTVEVTFNELVNADLQRFRVFAYNGDIEADPAVIVFQLRNREFALGVTEEVVIDESLVTQTVHVDPVNGDDANDGSTLALAKKTITSAILAAAANQSKGEGTKILLQPGIYQEGSPYNDLFTQPMIGMGPNAYPNPIRGKPSMPIIFEGAGWDGDWVNDDVIIQGSNRYTNWTHLGDNVYEHEWTIDWGVNATYPFAGSPIATRSYHGVNVRPTGDRYWQMYYHMDGPDDPAIQYVEPHEGYFWVDEEADYIRVKAPAGTDLTDSTLEVNVNERHRLFQFFQASGSVSSQKDTPMIFRNIVFRHGYRGPLLQNTGRVIIEDCSFENTKYFGFTYNSSYPGLIVRRCEFIRNGHSGGGADCYWKEGPANYLFEDNFFFENGRQATVLKFRGHLESQIKLAFVDGMTFRDFHMVNGHGVGLWLDTGLVNFEAYNGIIEGTSSAAVFVENHNRNNIENLGDQITVYLRDLWIRDGVFDPTWNSWNTKGVQTAESENWIADNLWIEEQERPYNFAYNNRGDIYQNIIKNTVAIQETTKPFYYGDPETWQQAFDTLTPEFGGNRYYGGMDNGFLNRLTTAVSFEDWVDAANSNPARNVSGIEEDSLRFPDPASARPTLGIYPTSREMSEGDSRDKGLLLTRLGAPVDAPLTVDLVYSTGGGSTDASDFVSLPSQVTIPADSISVYIPLSIVEDGQPEGLELFEVQVIEQGNFEVLAEPARISVIDADTSDLPIFRVLPIGDRIFENVDAPCNVRILREGILTGSVTLDFVEAGGAQMGVDYTVSPASLTFGPEDYEQIVEIRPISDDQVEGVEYVQLQLTQSSGEDVVIAAPSSLNIPINDNDGAVAESVAVSFAQALDDSLEASFQISNPGDSSIVYSLEWQKFTVNALGSESPDGPAADGYFDISATGTKSGWSWFFPNDDGFSQPIELPWSFNWYGDDYTTIHASSNGLIVFGNPSNKFARYATPVLLPLNTNDTVANSLAVAWANMKLDSSSGLYSEQVGDTFIIQWDNFLINGERTTFQVQFEEGNTLTAYYQVWPQGQDIMVGYQDSTKELGGSIIPLQSLPGTPYALRFDAVVPFLNSDTTSVQLAQGESATVDFLVTSKGLSLGENTGILSITSDSGPDSDQRLPVVVDYSQNPAIRDFGEAVTDLQEGWALVTDLGWIYTADWPYVYHSDLGWLYKLEGPGQHYWLALEWDSGWMYMPPSWYPYAYFYGNGFLTNKWGYLVTSVDTIWVYVVGEDWITLPRG